jgi:hypothetical protein
MTPRKPRESSSRPMKLRTLRIWMTTCSIPCWPNRVWNKPKLGGSGANRTDSACDSVPKPTKPQGAGPRGKVRALRVSHGGKVACRSMIPATRTKRAGRPAEKRRKIRCALDAGGWGALLQSWLLRAWISFRLSPYGIRSRCPAFSCWTRRTKIGTLGKTAVPARKIAGNCVTWGPRRFYTRPESEYPHVGN